MRVISEKCIIYAPNVHTGGGLVLLVSLLSDLQKQGSVAAILDERLKDKLAIPSDVSVMWIKPLLTSRLVGEWFLFRRVKEQSVVLCFHGLPPLLPCKATIVVFLQNRLLIQRSLSDQFKWKTRLRIAVERIWAKTFRHHVARYIVQTATMQRDMLAWLADSKAKKQVQVVPFVGGLPIMSASVETAPVYDFVYPADGEAHKNHQNLVAAWRLLEQEGIRPSLVLTLGERDSELLKNITEMAENAGLLITNLGQIPHDKVMALYASAKALIFPSLTESFGLPLIEASEMSLPILAPEFDYVRDVCVPVQTFDPNSPVSIARAVKRYLGRVEKQLKIRTTSEFLSEVFGDEMSR